MSDIIRLALKVSHASPDNKDWGLLNEKRNSTELDPVVIR